MDFNGFFKILSDFARFSWIFQDSVGFSQDFHGFSKIQVYFLRFKQFPKDSEQPACRDDDLTVDF